MRKSIPVLVLGLVLCGVAVAEGGDREYFGGERLDGTPLPFSNAVRVGDTLYVAGHLGLDPKTQTPPADAELEARLVMDGIRKSVESAGFTMDDLVSVTVFCPDLSQYDTFNRVYSSYFKGKFPARAFVGSGPLVRGARFEVLGVAVRTPARAAGSAAAH
ncbi:MAG: putative aminoacrylate peracid reductase RutC [Steroidobacteraceae bacterium]|nr:putative aminoacrylate peracid reductase RutC [Steroidobacteraceae bacterium]